MAWIKQKSDTDNPRTVPPESAARASAPPPPQRERRVSDRQVNIGQSVQIKGDLTGQEDLTIEGKLEGKVMLDSHQLTIGANGRVQGEIRARSVVVVGELIGDINADEKVEVAASGSMRGNIRAPRVVLVDGADFRGSVDMDSRETRPRQEAAQTTAASPAKKTPEEKAREQPVLAGVRE